MPERPVSLGQRLAPMMATLVCLAIAGLVGLDVVLNIRAMTEDTPGEAGGPEVTTPPPSSGHVPQSAPGPVPPPGPGSAQNCLEMPNGLLVCDVPSQP